MTRNGAPLLLLPAVVMRTDLFCTGRAGCRSAWSRSRTRARSPGAWENVRISPPMAPASVPGFPHRRGARLRGRGPDGKLRNPPRDGRPALPPCRGAPGRPRSHHRPGAPPDLSRAGTRRTDPRGPLGRRRRSRHPTSAARRTTRRGGTPSALCARPDAWRRTVGQGWPSAPSGEGRAWRSATLYRVQGRRRSSPHGPLRPPTGHAAPSAGRCPHDAN